VAPAKKQTKTRGAPSPSAKPVRQKKLTNKEKHAIRSANAKTVQAQAHQEIKNAVADRIADWPRKPDDYKAAVIHTGAVGRPRRALFDYTDEVDVQLFSLLSIGTSLDTISSLQGMPDLCDMLGWLADETHKFSSTYTRARKLVVPLYESRALDAAINPLKAVVKTTRQVPTKFGIETVEEVREGDNVERAKLMMSGYQWALGWMVPKKHGRHANPMSGEPNEQLAALFDSLKQGPADED
jgi:Bacteriophage Sf6, terminase small subunit-like